MFLVQHFCFAKVVACGRVIEREWGNPQRFPPHTPPSLRYARVRTTRPEGSHKNKTPSEGMGFCFWNAAGRFELAASTCAKRVKSRGEAGLLRMAMPFAGCRVASSNQRMIRPPGKRQERHTCRSCRLLSLSIIHRRFLRIHSAISTTGSAASTHPIEPRFSGVPGASSASHPA